jgi:hypothetical protein
MGVGGGGCIKRVFQGTFYFVLVSPPGRSGEGPDYHFPKEIGGLGPIRIWWVTYFLFLFWPSAQLGKLYHALASYFVSLYGFIFLCIAFALWFAS